MQTGSGDPPLIAGYVEAPAPLAPGITVDVPVPVLDPDGVCAAARRGADLLVPDESLLRLLEAAVAQLHQVIEDLRDVGAGTRHVADRIHALSAIEWQSPAGELFADRSRRLRARAEELAGTAEESVVLGRTAIDDLEHRIGRLRVDIAAAQAALVNTATLGAC